MTTALLLIFAYVVGFLAFASGMLSERTGGVNRYDTIGALLIMVCIGVAFLAGRGIS